MTKRTKKRTPKSKKPELITFTDQNVCEHGDHPAPPGMRFCSPACEECEHTEHDATKEECANVCGKNEKPWKQQLKEQRDKTLHFEMRMKRSAIRYYDDFERGDLRGKLRSARTKELVLECMSWVTKYKELQRMEKISSAKNLSEMPG